MHDVQVCVPNTLLTDASNLKVTLDGNTISYDALLKGDVWVITFIYPHSSHEVIMALNQKASNHADDPIGSLVNMLGSQSIFVVIIAVLIAVIAVLIILNRRKNK